MSSRPSPQERHRAFWDRMARCPTIDSLEREFAREAGAAGATRATIEAFLYSLRDRGMAALAEQETEQRLLELFPAQIEQCMERIAGHRTKYPDAAELLDALAEIVAGEA